MPKWFLGKRFGIFVGDCFEKRCPCAMQMTLRTSFTPRLRGKRGLAKAAIIATEPDPDSTCSCSAFGIQCSIFDIPYLYSLKRSILLITLFLFTASTLVMPYANFDDVRSLQAVYNHCLKQDADMDFLEFIGEKLLVAGFDPDEEDESPVGSHPLQPIQGSNMVQIQSGVLYQQQPQEINLQQPAEIPVAIPVSNTPLFSNDYHPGIFHPPGIA